MIVFGYNYTAVENCYTTKFLVIFGFVSAILGFVRTNLFKSNVKILKQNFHYLYNVNFLTFK